MSRPASSSMHFVCRQCRHALEKASPPGRRQFSSTPARDSRALPVFKPTSSPELDTLLTTIRHKYFLPQYLNEAQRKLIRSDKLRSQLENDPVFATFGDEEIRLEHIDVTKDMPKRAAFLEAIRLISQGEKKDWQNLPGLLEGYHRSKATIDPAWLGRMITEARKAGQLNVLVQCLQQVERNGFSLGIPAVRDGILLGIRQTAAEAEWKHDAIVKALKRAGTVLGHMEHPEHCGSRKVTEQDPRAEPYVIAVPLELAAVDAVVNGQDHMTKIELYSSRLITALAQQRSALTETSHWQVPDDLPLNQTKAAAKALNRTIAKFTVVRQALKLAQQVRGKGWAEEESAYAAHLQKQIEQKLDAAVQEAKRIEEKGVRVRMPAVGAWLATKEA